MVNLVPKGKKVEVGVIGYLDSTDAASGTKTRTHREAKLIVRVIDEEKYANMFLQADSKIVSGQVILAHYEVSIKLINEIDPIRGSSMQAMTLKDCKEIEGLVCELKEKKSITNEEAAEKLKSGKYMRLQDRGNDDWTIPPVYEQF